MHVGAMLLALMGASMGWSGGRALRLPGFPRVLVECIGFKDRTGHHVRRRRVVQVGLEAWRQLWSGFRHRPNASARHAAGFRDTGPGQHGVIPLADPTARGRNVVVVAAQAPSRRPIARAAPLRVDITGHPEEAGAVSQEFGNRQVSRRAIIPYPAPWLHMSQDLKFRTTKDAMDEARFSTNLFHRVAPFSTQVREVDTTLIASLDPFAVGPQPLTRIQLGEHRPGAIPAGDGERRHWPGMP